MFLEESTINTAANSEGAGDDQAQRYGAIEKSGPFEMQHLHGLGKGLFADLAKDQAQHNARH